MRQVFWGAPSEDWTRLRRTDGRGVVDRKQDSFSREQKSLGRKARPRGGKTGVRLQPLWVVWVRRSLG